VPIFYGGIGCFSGPAIGGSRGETASLRPALFMAPATEDMSTDLPEHWP